MTTATITTERKIGGSPPVITPAEEDARGWRETIESLVVALILAMLIRTFEAEAFVIPTGSMAPTLMGAHKDVVCPKCKFWYQVGDSDRSADIRQQIGAAVMGTCPMCGYKQEFKPREKVEHTTFSGDRILVNKFAYDFQDPQRWDVIVFKYPGNAKINYIKRLVGLPGERVRISHGDIFIRGKDAKDFEIARKPPHKLLAVLQNVHDTHYVPQELIDAGWPSRWETLPGSAVNWTVQDGGRSFKAQSAAGQTAWLAYQHQVPSEEAWAAIERGDSVAGEKPHSRLIRDFYAYNSTEYEARGSLESGFNRNWVGDLAMEAEFEVRSTSGTLDLVLIEAGRHHRCRINLADGAAELAITTANDEPYPFDNDAAGEEGVKRRLVATGIRGPGHYRLRWANVDDELVLWVNGSVVAPTAPATYKSPADERPYYRAPDVATRDPGDLGDLAPVRVGVTGGDVAVNRLRVLRDLYYIAVSWETDTDSEYERVPYSQANEVLDNPDLWGTTPLFASRRKLEFQMGEDQFFPLGDNSPYSKDARLWSERATDFQPEWTDHFFRREMLIGKAFVVYFPHLTYTVGVGSQPLMPNFSKMRRIQ